MSIVSLPKVSQGPALRSPTSSASRRGVPVLSQRAIAASTRSTGGAAARTFLGAPNARPLGVSAPQGLRAVVVSAGGDDPASAPELYALPRGPEATVQQAMGAVKRAFEDGQRRMSLEMLLPVMYATDLDDWPGGIRQQFKVAAPMVQDLLKGLKADPRLEGPIDTRIIDDGDAVGAWEGGNMSAVLFPTGQALKEIKEIASDEKKLVMIINPQWQGGQVVSDFGVGPWRAKNEAFVDGFDKVYVLKQIRACGEDVRLLRCYPGDWQVMVADPKDGKTEAVAVCKEQPTYKELEAMLKAREGSVAAMDVMDRLRYEMQFVQDSLKSVENKD